MRAAPVHWSIGIALLLVAGCRQPASPPVTSSASAASATATLASSALAASGVRHVDPAGAARLLAGSRVVVLDVRTPAEYADGHIGGAKLVDFRAPDFATRLAALDRNQTYLVHCASGGRSTASLTTFAKLGFKSVVHLDGGFNAWRSAGQPVER